jgi:CRISPR-associated protein Csx17
VVSTHRLGGCLVEPLGSYLKGLGVLRLVGEQVDPDATARWDGDVLVLATVLGPGELEEFLLDRYRPTPLVAPWNNGSGFSPKDKEARRAVELFMSSTSDRLGPYRDAIRIGQGVVRRAATAGWDQKKDKKLWVEACRAELPDASVAWVDAAVVLTSDEPRFPPLLGSGGNDGHFDFSVNFIHRLADVLCLRSGRRVPRRIDSQRWLAAALYGDSLVAGVKATVGQFDPGSAGGANSSPTGDAPSVVNPWDFVLSLEGAMLFAGAAARRLGTDTDGRAAMPFMMDSSAVGYASSAAQERSRGELWAPLWRRPATLAEVAQLLGEGRSEWRGRQVRSGLDMAQAVATLGVDRGVDAFARHAFLERRGLATAAVAVGRVGVRERPEVPLLGPLDDWLQQARRGKDPSSGVAAAVRNADRAVFELATSGGAQRLQRVLEAVAEAESALAKSSSFRERARLGPVHGLRAAAWLPFLDDGTPEVSVAAALASMREDEGDPDGEHGHRWSCLRFLVRPVGPGKRRGVIAWTKEPPPVTGFGLRPLCQVLADAHARRSIEVARNSVVADGNAELPGVQTAFRSRIPAPAGAVSAFVNDELDDERVEALLAGMMLLDWSAQPAVGHWFGDPSAAVSSPAACWALLAPFFHGRRLQGDNLELRPESAWPSLLARGRVEPVLDAALRRLRMARLQPVPTDPAVMASCGPAGPRLGAALLVPLSRTTSDALLRRVAPSPINQPSHEEVS